MEQAGDGLWQKLRRRKVVQWGIAYSVGAWGFLQGEYQKIAESSTIDSSTHVHRDPGFPRFLNSPAFKAVLERLGIPAYWREHGYPPQCRE
jgi:hypothetical protein